MAQYEIIKTEIDEFQMDCIHFGNGKIPMVIIPGVSINPIASMGASVVNAYKIFNDRYDVYLFDRKTPMPKEYSVYQMSEDTVKVMKKLGISNACIFGTSQGGMIAQYIAINHPTFVKKLILASTMSKMNDVAKATFKKWLELADKKDYQDIKYAMLTDLFSDRFIEMYGKMFIEMQPEITAKDCERFITQVNACVKFDCYNELEKITCPVLVIGAENDKVLSADASVEIADKLGCKLYIYKDYGHVVYDEAPDYKERILEFFEN